MGKLLMLAICCSVLAASQARQEDLDRNLLSFRDKPKQGHIEALKDNYVRQLFSQLLGRKLSFTSRNEPAREHARKNVGLSRLEDPNVVGSATAMPEALLLHRELQSRLGWGNDDNGGGANKNQYGPPQGFSQSMQQYGPPPPPPNKQYGPPPNPPNPPNQQYGPPPNPPNQQYGPPPNPPNQQYGPRAPPPNQQYGTPPSPNQQYGPPAPPPNQQYGPPPNSPNQQYGPPAPPPNQQYGPPPSPNQQYGPPAPPPNQQYGPPPNSPNQQYGPPPNSPNQQYGPPAPPPNQQYGPPPSPNQQYGPPAPPPNQQYGPPPNSPNQQYGPPPNPPNQEYGPPAPPPNQQYGPPPSPPNQEYGPPAPPPNQEYGPPPPPPNQEYGPPQSNRIRDSGKNQIRVNKGTFGGHIENFKLSDAVTKNNNNNAYSAPPQNQYGPPASLNDISSFNNEMGENAKIYKHVYIHTPPEEPEERQAPRVIRPNNKQDTHYQIIFVKSPAPKQQPPVEIELPTPPERKTLVYVLVKKPEHQAEIKFRAPSPTQPAKPEVYFIRYKGNRNNGGDIGGSQEFSDIQSIRNLDGDGGYSSSYDSQSQILGGTRIVDEIGVTNNNNNKIPDSVGYPNTEYRATPNMLNPNQEPMSISVYDRVRNGVMPPNSAGGGGSLSAASTNISVRSARHQGSHYTAPGSKPFAKASGKILNGQYIGMTSNVLNRQYYTEKG